MLYLAGGSRIPVACPSWHTDYTGYITWPPTPNSRGGHYADHWLADVCHGITAQSNILRESVATWLATADLSALDDEDDVAGHAALADSIMAAIKSARG